MPITVSDKLVIESLCNSIGHENVARLIQELQKEKLEKEEINRFDKKITKEDIEDNYNIQLIVECAFCSETFEHEGCAGDDMFALEAEMVTVLNNTGWTFLNSNEFMQIGLACPVCTDRERDYRRDTHE